LLPGTPGYDEKREQYAASSYPERMHPHLIAVPRSDSDDIPAAIRFAKANKKYLVARSGGHQYSGLSSGGEDTILLSMERFKHLEIKTAGAKTVARVGAGMLLTDVAAAFKKHGVTIPHGECPHVAIGGHAQSGGYGHLIRSYGLALDHVVEFKIYTADGTLRTLRRPSAQDRSNLFWGVLGGGPGSFGVVTEFTFECVRDSDHRYSWGSGRFYVYERELFNAAMNEVKDWTEKIASKDPRLPPDADMSMSIIDAKFFGKPVYVLELVNGNRDGRDAGGINRRFLEQTRSNILRGASWWNRNGIPFRGFVGNRPLSFMSDAFVRRRDFTKEGREYDEPYKKRLNCTKRPLTTAFVGQFVDLVHRALRTRHVNLVVQILMGGGAHATQDPMPSVSAVCHRDITLGIVFDCFYEPKGLQDAVRLQEEMNGLLGEFSGDQEVRMLWGSFGDTNLRNESVRRCYYDDDTWRDLQALKKAVDGGDLFHTEFTVQLP
jgi:FAD/FMN-containing dehydrogenase